MTWTQRAPVFGDMIRVKVSFYHHYGIYADDNTVYQFGLPDNVSQPADTVRVLVSDIDTFLQGGELEVAALTASERRRRRPPADTVEAAKARLHEGGYHILHNNCEHFATSCLFGEAQSSFVDSVRASIRKKLNKE